MRNRSSAGWNGWLFCLLWCRAGMGGMQMGQCAKATTLSARHCANVPHIRVPAAQYKRRHSQYTLNNNGYVTVESGLWTLIKQHLCPQRSKIDVAIFTFQKPTF